MLVQAGISFLVLSTVLGRAIAAPPLARALPTVKLDSATVTGISSGSTNKFLGIPFAQPLTGDLRFRLPQPLPPYNASFTAGAFGPACPQQAIPLPLVSGVPAYVMNDATNAKVISSAEDCLSLNVVTPAGVTPNSKLPVVVWIFGGGFEIGGSGVYDRAVIMDKAVELGVPAVYVSINYRLSAFGSLASQEVKNAGVGNLGLQDQRLALRWVQKYIGAFGGDPTKVTICSQSAEAISASLRMLTNGGNTEGLFRAAVMESGAPIPVGDITHGQQYYDAIVSETGCSGEPDTLQCLREMPYIAAPPTVKLDSATVTGISSGSTNKFLGIPFAQPPTGDLRFRLPQPLQPYNTSFTAGAFGPACPQQAITLPLVSGVPAYVMNDATNAFLAKVVSSAEDCLSLNVVTPAGVTPNSKLPVVVWIFGGGFEIGGSGVYDGAVIVEKAVELGVPAVYVSINYRLSAFGFLASQEVKNAGVGNLGLQDQRLALRWVQKYIGAFGGDPTKVTIWGQSAGAISVSLQMLTNGGNTEGLFRAAFMESGAPIPVGDITHGQQYYDAIVSETGCSGKADTLQCLREVPYQDLLDAMNESPGLFSYQSLILAWLPRVDGVFLTDNPQKLIQQGSVANVPFVSGSCDDEGTLFSLSNANITTNKQVAKYLHTYWLPNASTDEIKRLLTLYPRRYRKGSPFGTGMKNALTRQFMRLAAIQGDFVFQAPRRFFMQNQSGKQNMWSFVSKRFKKLPFLGSFHTSDLASFYIGGDMAAYLVRFVSNLDPNVGKTESEDLYWPQYTVDSPTMLELTDRKRGRTQSLTTDTYRVAPMAYVANLTLKYPI